MGDRSQLMSNQRIISYQLGDWCYSPDHRQLCRVIETQTLWGETVCCVWLPGKDTVVRLPATRLQPVQEESVGNVYRGRLSCCRSARDRWKRPLGGHPTPHVVKRCAHAIWGG